MRLLFNKLNSNRAFLLVCLLTFSLVNAFANDNFPENKILTDEFGKEYPVNFTCDNLTYGGQIEGDEMGFPNPVFDPAPITNVILPSGGSGVIEYLWIKTHNNPTLPVSQWTPIIGSNSMNYDPDPMDITTWYRRCARRSGCVEFIVESNIIEKTVLPCDNVLVGGSISSNQMGCAPLTPAMLTNLESPAGGTGDLEYLWWQSNVDVPFSSTSSDWTEIANSNAENFTPSPLNQTTYFIRTARRFDCEEYLGESNIVEITVLESPILNTAITSEIACFGDQTGAIDLTISGNNPPFQINWDNGIGAVEDPQNLPAGTYYVTVTNANSCPTETSVTITQPDELILDLTSTGTGCQGGTTGSATASILGGTPIAIGNYTYQWNDPNSQTTETATGLSPGIYEVTVTDANGCTGIENIEVENVGQIMIELSGVNESCLNLSNGSAAVSLVTNGIAPFTYLWSEAGQTASSIDNLSPGFYEVTVTDANGCTGVDNIEILEGTGLEIEVSGTNETCENSGDGSATVTSINNGTPPYSYQWDDQNNQSTSTATELTSGTFQVIITDATGCTGTAGVILTAGTALDLTISKTDVQCGGDADGTATATVSNGNPPFSYQWNDPNSQTTATAINLGMGNYQVTVTDNNGCSAVENVAIIAPMSFDFQIQKTDIECPNAANGTAEITISNGNINDFNFQWNDTNNSTTAAVSDLTAGNYEVTITDANGCMDIGNITINGPAPFDNMVMTSSTSCSDASDGSATVNVSGGTPPYSYLWNDPNGTTSNSLSNVSGGNYELTITDNVGCTVIENVFIFAPNPLSVSFENTPESCVGSMDGSAIATVSGGTGGYNFQWNDPNNSTTSTISNLASGTYSLTVTDANGCQITSNVNVSLSSTLTLNVTTTDLTCADANDGTATVTITGGQPNFSIQWNDDNNSTTGTISNLDVGFYGVTVTDEAGCTASETADIFEPTPIEITFSKENVVCSDDTDGAATATVTGGTPITIGDYFYHWSDPAEQTTQTADNLTVGIYQLDVTDANGCVGSATVEIEFTSNLTATVTTETVSCFGGNDGGVTVIPSGGVAPYSVIWASIGTGSTINNLPAGTYIATVTDAVGCTANLTATISQPNQIVCTASISSPIVNFGAANGALTVSPTGGTPIAIGDYTYEWSNGQTTPTANNISAGTYTVTVSDENDCTCSSEITINNPCKIGDLVWDDDNENGVYESDEDGMSGITVTLTGTTVDGAAVSETTITDNSGNYVFDNLPEGQFQLQFSLPNNHVFTAKNIGNEAIDSDVNPDTGMTEPFQLGAGDWNENMDAGIYQLDDKINIGNFVFLDSDRDGIQDQNETGVGGITVRLHSALTNNIVSVQTTNFSGYYLFADVQPGAYYLQFAPNSLPSSYVFTEQNNGIDDELDSDVDTLTGKTDVFEIFIFDADDYSFDAGVYAKCDNVTQGGEISGNEQLCGIGADPGIISNETFPSGGFGTLQYLWLQSSIPVYNGQGDPNWQPVPNSNTAFLNPGPITQTTYYIRCARRECCESYPEESNIIVKEIKQVPLANIEQFQNVACLNEEVDYAATNAGFGSVYSWDFAAGASPATASTRLVPNVSWNTEGVKTVALTVTKSGCSLTVTENISIVSCNTPNNLVTFNDFSVENMENQFMLKWEMSENLPAGLFYIQHSFDNEYFETMEMMENEEEELAYHFMDENPRRGENFYRIRFAPFIGQRIDSQIEIGFLEDTRSVNFYPNPFNSQATIELLERQEVPVFIQLNNNFGQVIQRLEIPAGEKTRVLNVNDLPDGLYFLEILQEGRRPRVERIFKADH